MSFSGKIGVCNSVEHKMNIFILNRCRTQQPLCNLTLKYYKHSVTFNKNKHYQTNTLLSTINMYNIQILHRNAKKFILQRKTTPHHIFIINYQM